jgi:hypothetical protein
VTQRAARLARNAVRLAALAVMAWAAVMLLDWVRTASDAMPGPGGRWLYYGVLVLGLVVYAVLLALPFVPGVEIGILFLAMQGPGAALPVYLATLAGLALAYAAGAALPPRWLAGALGDLGLPRAAALVHRAAPLPCEDRLALLRERLPPWLRRATGGWRYALLAAVLNAPGNWLLGGGGGIMLLAGLSGLFRPATTLATVALAVAPVPLAVWFFGIDLM